MKKTLIALIVILCLMLAAGCMPAADDVPSGADASDTLAPSTPTQTPSPTVPALLGPYAVTNYTIYDGLRNIIYDASAYYDENLSVWVSGLSDDGSALYFIECSGEANGALLCGCDASVEGTNCSLIRINGDGTDRKVLLTLGSDGLIGVQPFAGRVFFAQSEEANVSVGWVGVDGGEPTLLNLPAEDGGSYCYDAAFAEDGDGLLITARYYNDTTQSDTTQSWRVSADLSVTPA